MIPGWPVLISPFGAHDLKGLDIKACRVLYVLARLSRRNGTPKSFLDRRQPVSATPRFRRPTCAETSSLVRMAATNLSIVYRHCISSNRSDCRVHTGDLLHSRSTLPTGRGKIDHDATESNKGKTAPAGGILVFMRGLLGARVRYEVPAETGKQCYKQRALAPEHAIHTAENRDRRSVK